MSDDEQTAQDVISRYHQAISDRKIEEAIALTSGSIFRFVGNASGDPADWAAIAHQSGDQLRDWMSKTEVYANEVDFVSTSIRKCAALVVTRETGSMKSHDIVLSWKDCLNTWFLVQVEGEWRITSLFSRDEKWWEERRY